MRILVLDDDTEERHPNFARRFKGHVVVHVCTCAEACAALEKNPRFDLAQLDHDLCDFVEDPDSGLTFERTGTDVAEFIVLTLPKELRPKKIIVHSWNPGGAQRMLEMFRDVGIDAIRDAYKAM
jgi:hypothetical protein